MKRWGFLLLKGVKRRNGMEDVLEGGRDRAYARASGQAGRLQLRAVGPTGPEGVPSERPTTAHARRARRSASRSVMTRIEIEVADASEGGSVVECLWRRSILTSMLERAGVWAAVQLGVHENRTPRENELQAVIRRVQAPRRRAAYILKDGARRVPIEAELWNR